MSVGQKRLGVADGAWRCGWVAELRHLRGTQPKCSEGLPSPLSACTTYLCVGTSPTSCPEYIRIRNALVKFGLLRGMVATVSNARQNEILDILDTLERLTLND